MCKPKQISATPLLVRRWAASLPARRSSQGARGHSGCPVGCQPCPPALQQPPPLRPALPLSPALWSRVMLRAQPRKKKICRRQGETEGGAGADERRSHLYKKIFLRYLVQGRGLHGRSEAANRRSETSARALRGRGRCAGRCASEGQRCAGACNPGGSEA
jgi:hypothetical protein